MHDKKITESRKMHEAEITEDKDARYKGSHKTEMPHAQRLQKTKMHDTKMTENKNSPRCKDHTRQRYVIQKITQDKNVRYREITQDNKSA